MRRALDARRARPAYRSAPTRASAACCSTPTGATVAEGYHRGAGTPHAEVDALRRGRRRRPGRDRRRHPRALQPHRPHRAVRAGAGRRPAYAGWCFAQPDPNPVAAGGAATLRAAGVEVEGGLLARRGPRAQPGLDVRRRARPAVRDLEVRHHPRRPQRRRRRHQPLGHLAAARRDTHRLRGAVRHDAGRHRHRRGRRPAADRPRRGRRAAAATSRCAR